MYLHREELKSSHKFKVNQIFLLYIYCMLNKILYNLIFLIYLRQTFYGNITYDLGS